jgi:hypothetical protein
MQFRKRRARARRRSPISIDLLRPPGHTLCERIDETQDDYQGCVMLLLFAPVVLLAIFLGQAHVRGPARMGR